MASFYREATHEPPELEALIEGLREGDPDRFERKNFYLKPIIGTYGTPHARMANVYASVKPFEYELERLQEQERSRRNSESSNMIGFDEDHSQDFSTKNITRGLSTPMAGPMDLPIELWESIFSIIASGLDTDSYQSLGDLWGCALTCRLWSYIALPMLYRTHGYGVFMPKPATQDALPSLFPASRSINVYTCTAEKQMFQLWRTLLLSCFTASQPTSTARFATFKGATLFPYIKYVQKLDTRTLIMVLSEIMRTCKGKSKDLDEKLSHSTDAGNYFFAGALGAFEIFGIARRERMVIGGPEYTVYTPVWGKEIRLFVGDTALMMMDFLYPHLHHLKGFTVAELGQLRVSSPITMSHPVAFLSCLSSLNSLVIPSGWMVSTGLGRAIASMCPSILDKGSRFNLTILDWRFKTHYDPTYHRKEDWEADREDYRYTIRSAVEFFDALNANSVSSIDLDFEVRYNQQQQGDLGDGLLVVRQSKSLEALRIAHLRCNAPKLQNMLNRMGQAGFMPKALSLVELYKDLKYSHPGEQDWEFVSGMFGRLEDFELVRFPGMFHFANSLLKKRSDGSVAEKAAPPIKSLKLLYTKKYIEEAPLLSRAEYFFVRKIPLLSSTLTTLKLCDTAHLFNTQVEPRRRAQYNAYIYTDTIESPLESLVNLHTLILTGDITSFMIRKRLPQILKAIKKNLRVCDLCLSLSDLRGGELSSFLVCEKLEALYLRGWNWDCDEAFHTLKMLRVEDVKAFVEGCRTVFVGGNPPLKRLVMNELGIDGGLLQVAAWQNWGEVQKWVGERGAKFYWSPQQMWRVGYVAFNGRDPTFS